MKIRCAREDLLQALSAMGRIVPSRPSNPVLSGCLLFTREGSLVLQGTDLDLSLTLVVPVAVEEEGSTVVPIRYLLDLVRRLPEGEINLFQEEGSGLLEITYQNRATVKLNTWPAAEYPSVHPRAMGENLVFEGERWKEMIKKVIFAAAPREIRPNYAGVYFHLLQGRLNLVATDTYRLSLLKVPYTPENKEEDGLLVPAGVINETVKLVNDRDRLEITWDQKMVSFQTEGFVLTGRLIEARFPSYEKVVPASTELEFYVDKGILEACLERASLFVAPNEHFAVSELKVENGSLCITAQAAEVGSLYEELPLEGPPEGECTAFFNTRFLLDPLKAIDQQRVKIGMVGSGGPVVYREEGEISYLHLVLPVRRVDSPE